MLKDAPIGVFDSGVGGLTVVREIIRQLPSENVVYFGDTARLPYGSKSKETIISYSKQIIHFLRTKHVKAIVIACNTASACALDAIAPTLDIPIIGVVRPGAVMAAKATVNGKIGILGTESTIGSGIYTTFLRDLNPEITAFGKACPLFVPLVEEGLLNDPVTDEIATRYLKTIKDADADTLILGCTHYPLIRSTIRRLMGEGVNLINPAYETAVSLKEMLMTENIYREEGRPSYEFYVSDGTEKFSSFANSILPVKLKEARLVTLESI